MLPLSHDVPPSLRFPALLKGTWKNIQILETEKQKLPSSNDLFTSDKTAMFFRRRLETLNPHPNEINWKPFNFGLDIPNCWLFIIFVGSTQHIWHGRWTTSGLVYSGHFGSLRQLDCKYKEWMCIKLAVSNTVNSSTIFFLTCKDVVPMISVISDLFQWLQLLISTWLGCSMKYFALGPCMCEAKWKLSEQYSAISNIHNIAKGQHFLCIYLCALLKH